MDRDQEEMQFLGPFGIYQESYKIIISWRRIFSQITLALIVPLTFIFVAHIEVSVLLLSKINHNQFELTETQIGSKKYNKLTDTLSSERTALWVFEFVYFTFSLIFSLLSTAAVVYTIAAIYTGREVTFKKVMSVVPKVWKKLMVTFLCTYFVFFAYGIVLGIVLVIFLALLFFTIAPSQYGTVCLVTISILHLIWLVGLVYMIIVWELASVVSVLEEFRGFKAMTKSKALIRGKMRTAIAIIFMLNLPIAAILFLFERLVVNGEKFGVVSRVGFGILCFLLLFKLFLFRLVIQTVLYFVCKSYHHENIDKSTLSDHLKVYVGEYVPLKAKDVQLEHSQV